MLFKSMRMDNITQQVNVYEKRNPRTFQSLEARGKMKTQQRGLRRSSQKGREKSRENRSSGGPRKEAFQGGMFSWGRGLPDHVRWGPRSQPSDSATRKLLVILTTAGSGGVWSGFWAHTGPVAAPGQLWPLLSSWAPVLASPDNKWP